MPAAPTANPTPSPKPTQTLRLPALVLSSGTLAERIAELWPFDDRAALAVSGCESTGSPRHWNPQAVNGQHLGLFQIASRVHEARMRRLGVSRAELLTVKGNVKVAADLYADEGWGPWKASRGCHGLA